jgi:hypothetical protein
MRFKEIVANVRCTFTILKSGPPEVRMKTPFGEDTFTRGPDGWTSSGPNPILGASGPITFKPQPPFEAAMERLFSQVRPNALERLADV